MKTRLRLLLGEWWENTADGLPLFEEIVGRFFSTMGGIERVDLIFADRIMGTQGVAEIKEFNSELNPNTRVYSAAITVVTIYSEEFEILITSAGGGAVGVSLKGGNAFGVL